MRASDPFSWNDAGTWWMLACFAIVTARWAWERIRRSRASGWPTAAGHIETVSVVNAKESETRRGSLSLAYLTSFGHTHVAELGFSYSVEGGFHSGFYGREFETSEKAWEFCRGLKGMPVTVHYNPAKPSDAVLSEASLRQLGQGGAMSDAGSGMARVLLVILALVAILFLLTRYLLRQRGLQAQ